jgi:hypothetical protein
VVAVSFFVNIPSLVMVKSQNKWNMDTGIALTF